VKFLFDSHGGDSELNARTGQRVMVLRALTEQEADIFDDGKMFNIRFEDGFETDAFADELTLDEITPLEGQMFVADEITPLTEQQWRWFAVTRWAIEDVVAAAEEQGITLTENQARAWWQRNESRFQNLLVEQGNALLAEMDFNE